MKKALKLLPVSAFALAILVMGCGVPLPAMQLTATAESQPRIEVGSSSGDVQVTSAAPRNVAKTGSDEGKQTALAPLEHEETPVPTATATPKPLQQPTAAPTAEPVSQPANYAADLLTLLNEARVSRGLPALAVDASLTAASESYSKYMGQANFFGHYAPDGSSPKSRAAAAGFRGLCLCEVLSAGQGSAATALGDFMNSSAHAAILLDRNAVYVGVGYYYSPASTYKDYWTVMTGK
jgi:uncharacterized protein YkwD